MQYGANAPKTLKCLDKICNWWKKLDEEERIKGEKK